MPKNILKKIKLIFKKYQLISGDGLLLLLLIVALIIHYFGIIAAKVDNFILISLSIIAALPVIKSAFKSLKEKKVSIDLLASIALVVSLLAKEWTSATFINLMLTSARILGDYTENRSRRAIQSLLKLKPEKARIKIDGKVIETNINQIKKGDLVVAGLGERIPIDGSVVEGEASVDQSSLTGESFPVEKKLGDSVFSSTVIASGNLIIKTEKVGKETTLEKVIGLVEEAAEHKPKIITAVDKFTSWYVLVMLLGSAIFYLISHNLALVLAVLLVICADDIAVAIPLAFIASIGHAAKRGVIIKGGEFLEGLNKVKVIITDKTGTLTKGKLKVEDFFVFGNWEMKKVLSQAGTVSYSSTHPSAKAILNYLEKNK